MPTPSQPTIQTKHAVYQRSCPRCHWGTLMISRIEPEDTGLLPRPIPAEIFLHIKFKRLRDDGLVSIWDTRFPRFWYAFD
jgi:hypothetical protein